MKRSTTRSLASYMAQFDNHHNNQQHRRQQPDKKNYHNPDSPRLKRKYLGMPNLSGNLVHNFYNEIKSEGLDN